LFLFKTILVKRLKLNIHFANLVQALLFGCFHLSNMLYSTSQINNVYLQIIASSIGGLISGYSYIYSNSILPSFLAHAFNNTFAIHQEITEYDFIHKDQE
jgi:membrane protease YdiL (CAAX protease family)